MATRGNQINPIVEWHRPSDPQKPWGPQAEDSEVMRHRFDKKADPTHNFEPDKDYIMAMQVLVTATFPDGTVVEKYVTFDKTTKGDKIVNPAADGFTTPYQRKDFGYIVAYYEAVP